MAKVIRKKGDVDLQQLKVLLKDLGGKKLEVGWFESALYDEGTPVAGIAAVQEFGTVSGGIPPRPFMRPAVEEHEKDWRAFADQELKKVTAEEQSMTQFLEKLGLLVSGQIRKNIAQLTSPPLSPITLALRKQKLAGKTITGKTVGETAAAIAKGETKTGQLGDASGINPKPLVFDGVLLNSLTYVVSDA